MVKFLKNLTLKLWREKRMKKILKLIDVKKKQRRLDLQSYLLLIAAFITGSWLG